MSLYKRVFPKWGETWQEGQSTVGDEDEDDAMEE